MLNIPGKTKTQGMVAELEIEGLWEMLIHSHMYVYLYNTFISKYYSGTIFLPI